MAGSVRSGFAAVVGFAVALVLQSATAFAEPPGSFGGGYVGLNVGGAWGSSKYATDPGCPPAPLNAPFCNAFPDPAFINGVAVANSGSGRASSTGFAGGAQAGYNWQSGVLVLGGE